jgi:tetratricopeptide (TPR) repeat protein
MCSLPTGKINAASMAFMLQLRNSDYRETRRMMREMKKNAPADDVAALVYALERMLRIEEAEDLKGWMREKYPDYYLVRIQLADEASRKSDWSAVIDLLQELPREGLDDGSACHLCHLLGMAYFILGEVQQALDKWEEGLAYENGRCELEPYIDYAEVALRSPESGKRREATSAASRILSIFEQVDRHLADGQWKQAIAAVESMAPLTDADQQILARLAHAYLQVDFIPGEMRWVCKVLALANFLDCFKTSYKRDLVLPPRIEKWPESRLAEVARHAEHWFEKRVRPSGNTCAPATGAPPTQAPSGA